MCHNLFENYIFMRLIINSRDQLNIQEADYIFLTTLSDWSIRRIEIKIIVQKISENFQLGI